MKSMARRFGWNLTRKRASEGMGPVHRRSRVLKLRFLPGAAEGQPIVARGFMTSERRSRRAERALRGPIAPLPSSNRPDSLARWGRGQLLGGALRARARRCRVRLPHVAARPRGVGRAPPAARPRRGRGGRVPGRLLRLARKAGSVGGALPVWLHEVASRVAANSRRALQRRARTAPACRKGAKSI